MDTLRVMPKTRRLFLREGTRYTNAFAATPLCAPSRSSILTGRYPHNTGVRRNWQGRLLDMSTILPRYLRRANYATALSGKFLNSWSGRRAPPHFDRYAMIFQNRKRRYIDPTFNINGSIRRVSGYSTALIGRHAIKSVRRFERQDRRPWLLYVAPTAPHSPWTPEPKYADARVGRWRGNPAVRERDRSDKPPFVRKLDFTIEDGREVREGQLRTLMSVDDMIGRIYETLERLGEKRRTLAIFTSDNGVTWAEHGVGSHRSRDIREKRLPYTAAAKVPLLLRWPGHLPRGASSARLTGTVDIAPTILDAAGVPVDSTEHPVDGRSLLENALRDRYLLEHWREGDRGYPTWASLRTRTFQYTEYYAADNRTIFREYYRLRSDPWELRNLFRDGDPTNDPDVTQLASDLAQARACAGTESPRPCP